MKFNGKIRIALTSLTVVGLVACGPKSSFNKEDLKGPIIAPLKPLETAIINRHGEKKFSELKPADQTEVVEMMFKKFSDDLDTKKLLKIICHVGAIVESPEKRQCEQERDSCLAELTDASEKELKSMIAESKDDVMAKIRTLKIKVGLLNNLFNIVSDGQNLVAEFNCGDDQAAMMAKGLEFYAKVAAEHQLDEETFEELMGLLKASKFSVRGMDPPDII